MSLNNAKHHFVDPQASLGNVIITTSWISGFAGRCANFTRSRSVIGDFEKRFNQSTV
jgi:hypothetical protein